MSNSFEYRIYLILSLLILRIWLSTAPLVSLLPQAPNPSTAADVGPAFFVYAYYTKLLNPSSRKGNS